MKNAPREKKKATVAFSAIALLVLVAFIAVMLGVAKAPIVVVMLFSWLVMIPFALYLGYNLVEIEKAALDLDPPAVGDGPDDRRAAWCRFGSPRARSPL